MNRLAFCLAVFFSLGLFLLGSVSVFASGDSENNGWMAGSGNVQSQDRDVPVFTAVEVEASGNATIRQSSSRFVRVETDDNFLPLVKTEVVDGVLHLGFVRGARVTRVTRLEFSVASLEVSGITISGSGNARTASPLRTGNLSLDIRGSGSIACDADAKSLNATIGGSGGITARGHADRMSVTINGSGSIQAQDMQSANASVVINGSGDAAVNATDTVEVSISGSGCVRYSGGARASVHSTGSGSVREY